MRGPLKPPLGSKGFGAPLSGHSQMAPPNHLRGGFPGMGYPQMAYPQSNMTGYPPSNMVPIVNLPVPPVVTERSYRRFSNGHLANHFGNQATELPTEPQSYESKGADIAIFDIQLAPGATIMEVSVRILDSTGAFCKQVYFSRIGSNAAEGPSFDKVTGTLYNLLNNKFWIAESRVKHSHLQSAFQTVGATPPTPSGSAAISAIARRALKHKVQDTSLNSLGVFFGYGVVSPNTVANTELVFKVLQSCAMVTLFQGLFTDAENKDEEQLAQEEAAEEKQAAEKSSKAREQTQASEKSSQTAEDNNVSPSAVDDPSPAHEPSSSLIAKPVNEPWSQVADADEPWPSAAPAAEPAQKPPAVIEPKEEPEENEIIVEQDTAAPAPSSAPKEPASTEKSHTPSDAAPEPEPTEQNIIEEASPPQSQAPKPVAPPVPVAAKRNPSPRNMWGAQKLTLAQRLAKNQQNQPPPISRPQPPPKRTHAQKSPDSSQSTSSSKPQQRKTPTRPVQPRKPRVIQKDNEGFQTISRQKRIAPGKFQSRQFIVKALNNAVERNKVDGEKCVWISYEGGQKPLTPRCIMPLRWEHKTGNKYNVFVAKPMSDGRKGGRNEVFFAISKVKELRESKFSVDIPDQNQNGYEMDDR